MSDDHGYPHPDDVTPEVQDMVDADNAMEAERLRVAGRELDAWLWERFGHNVVAMDWPCGHDPECGNYWVVDYFRKGQYPEDSGYAERGPVYLLLEHADEWPPERFTDGDMLVGCVRPVPFLSTSYEGMGQIVEALRKRRWTLSIKTGLNGEAEAEFWLHGDRWVLDSFKATADTTPMAVALAAKAAIEGEKG